MSKVVEAIDRLLQGDMTPEARELLQRAKAVERGMTSAQERGKVQQRMDTWFLLFDGTSDDGTGQGRYCGRTTDKKKAMEHYKRCAANFYSTGGVDIVTDTKKERASIWTDWENL